MQKTWNDIEEEHAKLKSREFWAAEIIAWSWKVAKAKDFSILCLTVALVIISLKKWGK